MRSFYPWCLVYFVHEPIGQTGVSGARGWLIPQKVLFSPLYYWGDSLQLMPVCEHLQIISSSYSLWEVYHSLFRSCYQSFYFVSFKTLSKGKLLSVFLGVCLLTLLRSEQLNALIYIYKCIHFWLIWWILALCTLKPPQNCKYRTFLSSKMYSCASLQSEPLITSLLDEHWFPIH